MQYRNVSYNRYLVSAKAGSIGCLELLVNLDDIDLNVKNRLEGDTPLHKAVQYQDEDLPMAIAMVEILLEGGADPRYIYVTRVCA